MAAAQDVDMLSPCRPLAALAALLVSSTLLAGCRSSSSPAKELASYLAAHPLTGASSVHTGVVVDDACDCKAVQVVLAVDGADHVDSAPEVVARRLASAMTDLCSFRPSTEVRRQYLIDRLGPWRKADASLVIGAEHGLGPRCQASSIEGASRALVASVAAVDSVPDAAPAGSTNNFTSYAVHRSSSALPVAKALTDLSKYASTSLKIHDGMMDVAVDQKVLGSTELVTQLGRLMSVLPGGSEIHSYPGGIGCSDCGGLPDLPDPALVLSVDAAPDLVQRWAARAGVDTTPHDDRILLIASSRLVDHQPSYTKEELEQVS